MAGTIVADTLQDGAGNSTAMDNAIYGSAKAWVNFNGSTSTINGSYNVSSITATGTGRYTVNMTNAMANTNYSVVVSGCQSTSTGENRWIGCATSTTSAFFIAANDSNGAQINLPQVFASVFR